ncbi:hypothetical protein LXA43DRAFT_716232 [Ganoderma leucocontextum]|nr:hypothetical protein LXA43DRAFT_716232 [Ganoderma leucocontextum]
MLLATFQRVFRPVTASFDSERSRERDPLAGFSIRPSLCERGGDDTNSTSDGNLNSGDLHIDGVRISLDSLDNTPLLARNHSSQPSTSTMTTTTTTATTATVTASGEILHAGPSHVYWKTPHSGSGIGLGSQRPSGEAGPANSNSVDYASMHSHTPTSPVLWGSHSISRSVSSPSLQSPPSNASGMREYKPSSLGRQSSRSLRLPRDSLSASEDSDAESTSSLREHSTLPKQLSPIHEQQVPFPPHRKLSTDSVRTPDSTRTFDRITTHSTHSAFINRPLKRSLSQTSTSTHLSAMSNPTPPVIPPLDLRPNFQAATMGIPQGRQSPISLQVPIPRKSRLPVPTLPTVIGSPRQTNMVSVIYEDGASASARSSAYATAPASPNTPTAGPGERLSLHGLVDLFVDPDDIVTNPSRGSADTSGTVSTEATQRALSASLRDPASPTSDRGPGGRADSDARPNSRIILRPQNPVPPSTHSRWGTPRNSGSGGRLLSHSPFSLSSDGSSFLEKLDQRWLKGMSFGSGRFAHPPPAQAKREVTHAFVLFWAGFVAPWCWLIGGWLLSREGEAFEPEGPLLPLWHRRRADRGKHVAVDRGDGDSDHQHHAGGVSCGGGAHEFRGAADHKRTKATSWYPPIAPSVESLAPSTHSRGSAHKLRRHLHGHHGSRGVDPWIARCRVAAAVSGVLIFAGFIVAMVFVGIRA